MLVWLLKISEAIPTDETVSKGRTAMLAEKLVERGHEVVWWVSCFDHTKKRMVLEDDADLNLAPGILVKALKGMPYAASFSLRRYIDHRIIAWKFRKRADSVPLPHLIVACMPDYNLAWEAVAFARKRGIPIVVDIRDPWPDLFVDHAPSILKPLLRVVLYRDFQKLKRTLQAADAITSMVNGLLQWGLSKAGRRPTWKDRVFLIGAPRPNKGAGGSVSDRIAAVLEQVKTKFVVAFTGTFNRTYDPTVIINAAELLQQRKDLQGRIAFVMAGDGDYFSQTKNLAHKLGNVFFPGWVNRQERDSIHSVSSVGVVPGTLPGAFPNKAFAYLSAGLPVLSSTGGDLNRLLSDYDAGYYFGAGNHVQLASLIVKLLEEPGLQRKMAQNARRLFDERLDADKIYSSFVDHLEALARERPAHGAKATDKELFKTGAAT